MVRRHVGAPLQRGRAWYFSPLQTKAQQVMLAVRNQENRAISVRISVNGTAQEVQIPANNGAEIVVNPRDVRSRIDVSASGPVIVQRLVIWGAMVQTTNGTPTMAP